MIISEKLNLEIQNKGRGLQRYTIQLGIGPVSLPSSAYRSMRTVRTEWYNVTVRADPEVIALNGGSCRGLYYAIQTLLALRTEDGAVQEVDVVDAPRFAYRGFMLDVARNFFPKEQVLEVIDVMGMYKMNKLHLHLSDDQAWRLDIPGLPELVKVCLVVFTTLLDPLRCNTFVNS